MKKNLSITIAGVELKNPIMSAAGCFGLGNAQFINFKTLGALVPKTVTRYPREGNPCPRLAEVENGLMNSIGLANKGIAHFIEVDLPQWQAFGPPVIVNISGFSIVEYVKMAKMLQTAGVKIIELNVSCPNVDHGMAFGVNPDFTHQLVKAVKEVFQGVVIVKLTPNTDNNNLERVVKATALAGADVISAFNTFARDCDRLGTGKGGLSGPVIRPLVLPKLKVVCNATILPVIAIGGVSCAADAREYLDIAGVVAVGVGTANFANPNVMNEIIAELER